LNITKKDFVWNLAATIFKISSSALLIPIILIKMPTETVAIYTILITISSIIYVLDFGFNPSFTRNVTYVFSGVSELKSSGISIKRFSNSINYDLLSDLIFSMKWFYSRLSFIVGALLVIFGIPYFYFTLQNYPHDITEAWLIYLVFCISTVINLYTLYYESLLIGSGKIKSSKKILILGQSVYILFSLIFIFLFNSLLYVFLSQIISTLIVRYFSKLVFFKHFNLKNINNFTKTINVKDFIKKTILPNAVKIGLTSVGGVLVTKSSFFLGTLFLSLDKVSSYGITIQILNIVNIVSIVYLNTFIPKISQLRVNNEKEKIYIIVRKGLLFLIFIYFISTIFIVFCGSEILAFLGSNTLLIEPKILLIFLIINFFIESIILYSGNVLLTKNEVPFYRASIISGIVLLFLFIFLLNKFSFYLEILILTPLIVNISYQGWKWFWEVYKDLKL
jgi:O-antigen/teichoic acid export membrane protein